LEVRPPLDAGNRDDVGAFRQQPGKRELRRRAPFVPSHLLQALYERDVLLKVRVLESRQEAADVGRPEHLGIPDRGAQEPAAERAERDEADPELAACWQ